MIGSSLLTMAGGSRVQVALGLTPAFSGAVAVGPALTVQGAPGDNLALHHAVAAARPGDVIVLAVGEERRIAHCGEILALAARTRGVAGIVLDGAVRDLAELAEVGLPVFHLGASPRSPAKAGPGAVGVQVELRGARVSPGDLVCADADGVAFAAAADADELKAAAEAIVSRERDVMAALGRGETTVSIFGLGELP